MPRHLVLYDGVCGLCNGLVGFLIPRDKRDRFRFAPIQASMAREILEGYGKDPTDLDTFYLVVDYDTHQRRLLQKARAALFVLKELGGLWRGTALLRVLPARLLDSGYDFIARNRYRWFGRYETCLAPTPEIRSKFLAEA